MWFHLVLYMFHCSNSINCTEQFYRLKILATSDTDCFNNKSLFILLISTEEAVHSGNFFSAKITDKYPPILFLKSDL